MTSSQHSWGGCCASKDIERRFCSPFSLVILIQLRSRTLPYFGFGARSSASGCFGSSCRSFQNASDTNLPRSSCSSTRLGNNWGAFCFRKTQRRKERFQNRRAAAHTCLIFGAELSQEGLTFKQFPRRLAQERAVFLNSFNCSEDKGLRVAGCKACL